MTGRAATRTVRSTRGWGHRTTLTANSFIAVGALLVLIVSPSLAGQGPSVGSRTTDFRSLTPDEDAMVGEVAASTGAGAGADADADADAEVEVVVDLVTDLISYVGAPAGSDPVVPAAAAIDPIPAAEAFVARNAVALGVGGDGAALVPIGATDSLGSGGAVSFQQTYNGVPVLGGEVQVSVGAGGVRAVVADLAPALDVDTTAGVSPDMARANAATWVARQEGVAASGLTAGAADLAIYNNDVMGGPGDGRNHLVWRTEVTSSAQPMRYLVLVEADLGAVLTGFDQVATALDREVCDWNNVASAPDGCTGAGAVRSEGDPATGIVEADAAYDATGDFYDFFFNRFGYDSYDGAGATMYANTRYCGGGFGCPMVNAFWSGDQIHLGDGFGVADDVVGHEWAHAYTEYNNDLFYYYQSGALSESYSDLWGEFVDQTNALGTDTVAVRWLMGEDAPGGAIRNMADPTAFGDPDRMLSGLYELGTGDSGGVHSNSGIMNKAAYLLTDGDIFNGVAVSPIGLDKTAAVFFEAATTLLGSASDYQDLDGALVSACTALIGTFGITAGDCTEVSDATDATEMGEIPVTNLPTMPSEAPVCDAGTPTFLFDDDLEVPGSGNWALSTTGGDTEFFYPQNPNAFSPDWDPTYATSGVINAWANNGAVTGEAAMTMTADVAIPTLGGGEEAHLRFDHSWQFEPADWDGGLVEYSINGGASWSNAAALFDHNGQNGMISAMATNPRGGESAFVDRSYGMTSSRLDLSSLAGSSIRFRFVVATDNVNAAAGWFIDTIQIYTCAAPATTTSTTSNTSTIPTSTTITAPSSTTTSTSTTTVPTTTTSTTAPTTTTTIAPTTTTSTTAPTTTTTTVPTTTTSTTAPTTTTTTVPTTTTSTTAPTTTTTTTTTAPTTTTSTTTSTTAPTTTSTTTVPTSSTTTALSGTTTTSSTSTIPAARVTVDISPPSGLLGEPITVFGAGCDPDMAFTVAVDGIEVGAGTTNGSGDYTVSVVFPINLPDGEVALSVTCGAAVGSLVLVVSDDGFVPTAGTTATPTPTPTSTLPVTGSASQTMALAGALLMAVGVAILVVSRHRQILAGG